MAYGETFRSTKINSAAVADADLTGAAKNARTLDFII
jgi:hypothetical protein